MSLTIRQKADTVGTFRHLSISYMEMLARWVPSTPEMEAKVLFGRHIWEFAQHADALGKRTHELRAALHYTRPSADEYESVAKELAGRTVSRERFHGFYGAALVDLDARYEAYLDDTDPMLDEPTVRIVERIRTDISRMRAEAEECVGECPAVADDGGSIAPELLAEFVAVEGFGFVDFRPTRETDMEIFS